MRWLDRLLRRDLDFPRYGAQLIQDPPPADADVPPALLLDRACPHENFHAEVVVNRLEDTGKFAAHIRIWCKHCDEPFVFLGDLPIGLDLSGVATSLDSRELRCGIYPETEAALLGGDR